MIFALAGNQNCGKTTLFDIHRKEDTDAHIRLQRPPPHLRTGGLKA